MRKIFNYFLIIFLIIILLIYLSLDFILFNIGNKYFQEKKYKQALIYYNLAYKIKPKSSLYINNLSNVLLKLPLTYNNQKMLVDILNLPEEEYPTIKGSKYLILDRLNEYKFRMLMAYGRNYIDLITYNNKIIRWNEKTFPLRVYVNNKSMKEIPEYYKESVKEAFDNWSRSTNNFLKFILVNEEESDIYIEFQDSKNTYNKNNKQDSYEYIVANTYPEIKDNKLKRMVIRYGIYNFEGKLYKREEVYRTLLHEIGHALGLMGHSLDDTSLMYMSSKNNVCGYNYQYIIDTITPIDINTLYLLYSMRPDITNKKIEIEENSKIIHPEVIIGNNKAVANKNIKAALDYIKNAPNIPNGYIDLAIAYYELNEFKKAIDNLKIALNLSYNPENRYIIYYNLSNVYLQMKKYKDVIEYARLAKKIKSEDIDLSIIENYARYKLGNKEGLDNLELLYEQNRANENFALVLINIYLERKEYRKIGRIIKTITENNKESKLNEQIKSLYLLKFLSN